MILAVAALVPALVVIVAIWGFLVPPSRTIAVFCILCDFGVMADNESVLIFLAQPSTTRTLMLHTDTGGYHDGFVLSYSFDEVFAHVDWPHIEGMWGSDHKGRSQLGVKLSQAAVFLVSFALSYLLILYWRLRRRVHIKQSERRSNGCDRAVPGVVGKRERRNA